MTPSLGGVGGPGMMHGSRVAEARSVAAGGAVCGSGAVQEGQRKEKYGALGPFYSPGNLIKLVA